ncbi:hypothetical protein D3C81_1444860 [compost metagenome]
MTVLVQLDLQHLAALELAELLGLLITGQYLVHGAGRQADFGKQGRQGIAPAHGDFAMAWVFGRGS